MKYMTKVEWILEDESWMLYSSSVSKKENIAREKLNNPLTSKMIWNIVDKQIKKKLKNPMLAEGICTCDDYFLCKHRRKYLKEVLDGEGKTSKA